MNSRNKGVRGELEWRDELTRRGYTAERGQQHAGGGDSPDVIHDIPGVHFEVKRTERFSLYAAVDQARYDASCSLEPKMPVVVHRCNGNRGKRTSCRGDWLIVLGADDYFQLLKDAGHGPISTT